MPLTLNVPLPAAASANLLASSSTQPSKLHKAAQDFEALLVGEMLKSSREAGSDGWLGNGESTGDDSAMAMAESQLANTLSAGGGIGLAKTIERAMSQSLTQNTSETQPAGSIISSLKKP